MTNQVKRIVIGIAIVMAVFLATGMSQATGDTSGHSPLLRTTTYTTQKNIQEIQSVSSVNNSLRNRVIKLSKENKKLKLKVSAYQAFLFLEVSQKIRLQSEVASLKSQLDKYKASVLSRESQTPIKVNDAPDNSSGSPCQYSDLIHSYFGSMGNWAVSIAWRESRCISSARNPSGASGLFQMMLPLHSQIFYDVGCSPSSWADPVCNVKAAKRLYDIAGTSPWNL